MAMYRPGHDIEEFRIGDHVKYSEDDPYTTDENSEAVILNGGFAATLNDGAVGDDVRIRITKKKGNEISEFEITVSELRAMSEKLIKKTKEQFIIRDTVFDVIAKDGYDQLVIEHPDKSKRRFYLVKKSLGM